MKIFISWSGNRSKAVAETITNWLKCVIQASDPWISTRDIDRGALWFSEINNNLKDVSIGIVCLTQENKNKPWILFETGALAKGLTTNRVCTFLIDLNPEDLQDPLSQFNHTVPTKESIWELVKTINRCLDDNSLNRDTLQQVFDTYWPQFENDFAALLKDCPQIENENTEPRTEHELLAEILTNTRRLSKRMNKIELSTKNNEKQFPATSINPTNAALEMLTLGLYPDNIISNLVRLGFLKKEATEALEEAQFKQIIGES